MIQPREVRFAIVDDLNNSLKSENNSIRLSCNISVWEMYLPRKSLMEQIIWRRKSRPCYNVRLKKNGLPQYRKHDCHMQND